MLQSHFKLLSGMLAGGQVKPLPFIQYDFAEVVTALRQYSHARHTGKIVVSLPSRLFTSPALESREAWAIAGGLGALGTITAEWLAGQGARHIHLLGRSGRWAEETAGESGCNLERVFQVNACVSLLHSMRLLQNLYDSDFERIWCRNDNVLNKHSSCRVSGLRHGWQVRKQHHSSAVRHRQH